MMSNGLKTKAQELGLWNGQGEFNFSNIFSEHGTDGCQRYKNGSQLLETSTSSGTQFNARNMFNILRDEGSGICMRNGVFVSTSSQVTRVNVRFQEFGVLGCNIENNCSPGFSTQSF